MGDCLKSWVALAGLLLTGHALAQSSSPSPSLLAECLRHTQGAGAAPTYPTDLDAAGVGGDVQVEMRFEAADREPAVTWKPPTSGIGPLQAFVDTTLEFARGYRLPCLSPGSSGVLQQTFVFNATGRPVVTRYRPRDNADQRQAELLKCLTKLGPPFAYPDRARRRGEYGTVVVRSTFSSADAEPNVEVLEDAGSSDLAAAAVDHVRQQRVPCHDGKGAVSFNTQYQFRFEGQEPKLDRVTLKQLAASIKDIRSTSVYFDFARMNCPFEAQITWRWPHSRNVVAQLGTTDARRAMFLDWLTHVTLDLPPRASNRLLGVRTIVEVPCGVLDLGPARGGAAGQ